MKTFSPRRLAVIGGLLTAFFANAQSECADYHRFNCDRSGDTRFSVNGQSKSASVQVGVPTELNIIVYKGQDYRVSFCYDEKVLGDHVMARLLEKVREPREVVGPVVHREEVLDEQGNPTGRFKEETRVEKHTEFEEVKKVLWDNSEHEMAESIEFTATATKRLIVEVTAPGATNPKPKRSDKAYDIGCVGILIEHMPTPQMGFGGK